MTYHMTKIVGIFPTGIFRTDTPCMSAPLLCAKTFYLNSKILKITTTHYKQWLCTVLDTQKTHYSLPEQKTIAVDSELSI